MTSLFERVKNTPLLILDDYGEHSTTPWAQEKLYQLINHRYNARLPMVVTMCCGLDEVETRVGSRLADPRISLVYAIMAPDYRADRSAARSAAQPRPAAQAEQGAKQRGQREGVGQAAPGRWTSLGRQEYGRGGNPVTGASTPYRLNLATLEFLDALSHPSKFLL